MRDDRCDADTGPFSDDALVCNENDVCYRAVTETYRQLRARGMTDLASFNAAVSVFRHHHPDVAAERVPYMVADWIR